MKPLIDQWSAFRKRAYPVPASAEVGKFTNTSTDGSVKTYFLDEPARVSPGDELYADLKRGGFIVKTPKKVVSRKNWEFLQPAIMKTVKFYPFKK